jgi:hypothetical protein
LLWLQTFLFTVLISNYLIREITQGQFNCEALLNTNENKQYVKNQRSRQTKKPAGFHQTGFKINQLYKKFYLIA